MRRLCVYVIHNLILPIEWHFSACLPSSSIGIKIYYPERLEDNRNHLK
jgi:hypothetical protein